MSYAADRYGVTRPHRRAAHAPNPDNLPSRQTIRRNRGGKRQPDNRRRISSQRILETARRDIVRLFHNKGYLGAVNFKDAVGQLFKRLKHSKQVITTAFSQLTKGRVIIYDDSAFAYRLAA